MGLKPWFITNGMDAGLPQLIGTVVQETIALRGAEKGPNLQIRRSRENWTALTLIGVVCDQEIKDIANCLKEKTDIKINIDKRDKYSLNSDHTHFIIVREKPPITTFSNDTENKSSRTDSDEKLIDLANSNTNRFRDGFEIFLREKATRQITKPPSTLETNVTTDDTKAFNDIGFPMVYVLLRGTLGTIEILHQKLQQVVPIVIIKGTGSAADIIAFASDAINVKNNKSGEDENLKTELYQCLLDEYPTLNDETIKHHKIRDQIIDIVKENEQTKRKFLSFIDINSSTLSSNDFHKSILSAYLQAQTVMIGDEINVEMQNTLLHLTLAWGLVDIVQQEIFHRDDFVGYVIPDSLFEQALLGEDLEAFVDVFLERNFLLHRYVGEMKLHNLFVQQKRKDPDFFTTTSLEGILGWTGDEMELPSCFIKHGLINIIKRFTNLKKILSKVDSRTNSHETPNQNLHYQLIRAETQAIRCLVICAVLANRHTLAKILWKRTSEPISLALFCSMMLNKLTSYCREPYLKSLIKKQAKEFSDYAIGVLDKSFKDNATRTFEMLSITHMDWDDITVVQLAYNCDNKEFMAHPILQKWVVRQFYGPITPRELSWGFFTCPEYLKIILSACLIFPMWFWIHFSQIGQEMIPTEEKKDSSNKTNTAKRSPRGLFACTGGQCFRQSGCQSCRDQKKYTEKKKRRVFWRIKTLWSAPITKFYMNFVVYLLFLSLFTLAVLWPSCGNLYLDYIVWFWAAFIALENTRITYAKHRSRSDLPLVGDILEIIVQVIFLSLYLAIRIIGLWNFGTCQIVTAKAILGVGLIYYYYRVLFIYLPISSTFGPMMIRLQYMVSDDFVTFLRLFIIFMISSGVAITVVLYPHHPLDWDLLSKAILFRGLMALFTSEMSDLKTSHQRCRINATTETEKKSVCLDLSHSFRYGNMSVYQRYGISTPFCRQTSWIAWLLLIQYFFLAKRLLISLLTALFSVTGARIQKQSEHIWCHNQYAILVEYQKRPRLPPPFAIISYIIERIMTDYRRCILSLKKYSNSRNVRSREQYRPTTNTGNDMTPTKMPLIVETNPKDASNGAQVNSSVRTVRGDSSLLERILKYKCFQKVIDKESKKKISAKKDSEANEASIYWKQKAKEYFVQNEAAENTKSKASSGINVQKDIDVLRKSMLQTKDRIVTLEKTINGSVVRLDKIFAILSQEDKMFTESPKKFVHIYSHASPYVYTNDVRFPVAEKFVPWKTPLEMYRPTLITLPKDHSCFSDNDRPFVERNWSQTIEPATTSNVSQLDVQFPVPLNPLGRTGVRGRGALIHWGANKSIMAIITRWKKIDNEFVTIEGNRVLETMLFIDTNTRNFRFVEGKMIGEESPYSAVCRVFNELAFQNKNVELSSSFQKQNMIEFFESFARSNEFESHIIYRGYIDDVRNTDNAWIEADIWNFHYGSVTSFPGLRNDETVLWENMTHNLRRVSVQSSILRKIAQIHDAYFD